MFEAISGLSAAFGLSGSAGLNAYIPLLVVALAARFPMSDPLVKLQAPFDLMGSWWAIGLIAVLLGIEIVADKIPAIDSINDGIQTFIRIPAGAVLAALAMGEHPPELMLVAGLLGGSIAAGTHLAKAGGRALINTSPEPFSNVAASLGEEAMVAGGLYAAIYHPVVFLIILGGFVILLIWLLPKLIRGIRMLFGRLFRPSRST